MIRQLSARCWYVDDDGEAGPPHVASQAEAWACAAEVAAEGRPGPVLRRTPAPGWLAACARCGCPLGDQQECWVQLHCASRAELLAELETAGWGQAVPVGGCCPGCAAARPALADVTWVAVTVHAEGTAYEVVGETTACPQLVVTALRGAAPEVGWLGVVLTHRPTGRHLPTQAWTDDVPVLHGRAMKRLQVVVRGDAVDIPAVTRPSQGTGPGSQA